MEMESLTGHTKADKTENSGVSSCSLFSCCNVNTEDNTDTPEALKTDTEEAYKEESDALEEKVEALERKVEEAEETINTLTKEKSEAEETNNTLTEATKGYKLKVETLEYENAKLREELSKKASL